MGVPVSIVVTLMLITGCSNSILTKFQDKQCVGNCDAPASQRQIFDQPVVQTIQMFVAEMFVGVVLIYHFFEQRINKSRKTKDSKSHIHNSGSDGSSGYQDNNESDNANENTALLANGEPSGAVTVAIEAVAASAAAESANTGTKSKLGGKKVFLLAIPASCDLLATTMMNVGLLLVPVSVFQMVRGAIVLFVGFFSVTFLKRKLYKKQWIGLLSVFGGVFIVGLSAMLSPDAEQPPADGGNGGSGGDNTNTAPIDTEVALQATIGVALILAAQLFSATQYVVEEFILEKYSMEPLNVVLWEGTFGASITVLGSLIVAQFFLGKEKLDGSMFNLQQGFGELLGNKALITSSIVIMFMMSTFNVTGMTVTRMISATSRSTIDTSRTVGIWIVSMILGWESFKFLQLGGFLLLVYGTLLFNGIIGNDTKVKENVEEMLPNEFEHT